MFTLGDSLANSPRVRFWIPRCRVYIERTSLTGAVGTEQFPPDMCMTSRRYHPPALPFRICDGFMYVFVWMGCHVDGRDHFAVLSTSGMSLRNFFILGSMTTKQYGWCGLRR